MEFTILHFLCHRPRPQGIVSCSTFGVQDLSVLWLLLIYAGRYVCLNKRLVGFSLTW